MKWFAGFFGAAILLTSCSHNTIKLSRATDGKIVLHPEYGDILQWEPGPTHLQVEFLYTPCEEGTKPKDDICHVNVKPQPTELISYDYICKDDHGVAACRDPEVEVGTSNRGDEKATGARSSYPTGDFTVALGCVSGVVVPRFKDVTSANYGQPVNAGETILWKSNGSPVLTDWSVTFMDGNNQDITATVCDETAISGNGTPTCKLKMPTFAQSGSVTYSYVAKSAQCNNEQGKGQGTVVVTKVITN